MLVHHCVLTLPLRRLQIACTFLSFLCACYPLRICVRMISSSMEKDVISNTVHGAISCFILGQSTTIGLDGLAFRSWIWGDATDTVAPFGAIFHWLWEILSLCWWIDTNHAASYFVIPLILLLLGVSLLALMRLCLSVCPLCCFLLPCLRSHT